MRDGLTTKEKEMALAAEAAEKVDADLSAKQKEVNNHTFMQCFGSGKKYYGSGSDPKIISRIRILLEIILYCFTEVYF